MVRISFGLCNTTGEVDHAIDMLRRIVRQDYRGRYYQVQATGDYRPAGYDDPIRRHLPIEAKMSACGGPGAQGESSLPFTAPASRS